jgi:hypothetical protein
VKKFVQISFSTGHVYEVPTQAIAEDRTRYYAMSDPGRTREQHAAETQMLFASEFDLFDWAKNNMNWSDLQKTSRLVAFNPPDFAKLWDDAEMKTSDENLRSDIMALGENALAAPVEMLLAQAVSENKSCFAVAFQQSNGNTTSAVVGLVGSPDIIEGYLATITQFDDFLSSQSTQATGH